METLHTQGDQCTACKKVSEATSRNIMVKLLEPEKNERELESSRRKMVHHIQGLLN